MICIPTHQETLIDKTREIVRHANIPISSLEDVLSGYLDEATEIRSIFGSDKEMMIAIKWYCTEDDSGNFPAFLRKHTDEMIAIA